MTGLPLTLTLENKHAYYHKCHYSNNMQQVHNLFI